MIYELVVVDDRELADSYPVVIDTNHVRQVICVGQIICGLRYGAIRPNKLTRKHRPLTSERERQWESECLLPAMDMRISY